MKHNPVKRVWDALPFSILWRIWIAQNNMIFRNKETSIRHLCIKAKNLAVGTIASKLTRKIDRSSLWVEEKYFIRNLTEKISIPLTVNSCKNPGKANKIRWKIRLKQTDFNNWLCSSNIHSLFFDGASKSNLGTAGAGGIILNPLGEPLVSFEWGLGTLSNNRVEALALYQGILQLQTQGIKKSLIFGDSAIIISLMNSQRKASNILLQQIINRSKILINHDMEFHFYHIFQTINCEADKRAIHACSQPKGNLFCNNEDSF